ncbi:MAG: proline hydroxylase [Cyanobacteria bacterium CRU_2_1]|nr:proline hydroxylase [Cyanobacteria bacterium RU_5_0]NJR60354.1 proline hydroxylase [Cyanobacteria bacterium CRU_2_1]
MQSDSQALQAQEMPEEIQLTLLLSGGQQYSLLIEPDNPLVQQLFEVLVDWEGKRSRRLFQVPIGQGQAMLTFPCDRLIGVISEPPLVVQAPPAPTGHQFTTPSEPEVSHNPLVSDYVQLEQFLAPHEHQHLLDYVLEREAEFVSTRTSTGATNYRESVVMYSFPEFSQLFEQRIRAIMPDILAKLGLPSFPIGQIEAQLTAHNDGNFYKVHNDNGSSDTATRELTYVYYFYREPKPFSDGELVIYDSKVENNYYVKADTFRTIEPRNNSIVFFLSRYMHEVLPVRCPSQAFADSRFTINGWVRRG